MKVAIFVSRTGSLLEAMIKDGLPIDLVHADRECRGLQIAVDAGIPTQLLKRTNFGLGKNFNRKLYTYGVIHILHRYEIGLIAMAGYMTVLHAVIFDEFGGRILNTHPSLFEAGHALFKGAHTVRDALAAGVKVTGCTIHVATPELDAGEVLAEKAMRVLPGDIEAVLWERIKEVERKLYPETIRAYAKTFE